MSSTPEQLQQAALGLEQLSLLTRMQSWRHNGTPSLPPTQTAVLRILQGQPAGQRQRQLAERLGVSAPSLSDSLKALEAKGWIARAADLSDGRASIVRLTAEGSVLAQQLLAPSSSMTALLQTLSGDDLGAFLRVIQLLVYQAQQQGLATGPRTCLGCNFFRPHVGGDARKPHFCDLVKQPFGDPELRVDCPEQVAAEPQRAIANATRYRLADTV